MRAALIVGIDYYNNPEIECLHGCVNDAYSVGATLARHDGGSVNFDCRIFTATGPGSEISKADLKDQISDLFIKDAEIALFYFAGHGHIESTGGYILASDAYRGDDGLPLTDILNLANKSPAKNKIIILDSCHSGVMGASANSPNLSSLAEGVTVLTASTKDQYASEENGHGVFTSLLVDALNGSAANLTGDITPGSVYAHIDQSLGAWEQRPVFKTNVKQFVSLRKTSPAISDDDLRMIPTLFPDAGYIFQLDPTYEPEMKGRDEGMPGPVEENTKIFAVLQKYNRLNLLVPEGAPHMWNAAMESKACRLTALGEHYRRLVVNNRI